MVTTDPGSGKSPALASMLKPLFACFEHEDIRDKLPGCPDEKFHVLTESTHAAFNVRAVQSDGYGLGAFPEANTALCPEYPRTGNFARDRFIVFSRLLETANGGKYDWDTQAHGYWCVYAFLVFVRFSTKRASS